jgi:hypothetical protein
MASDRSARNASSADNVTTGSAAARVDRQAAASSIQTGISWRRTTEVPMRLHRADAPVALSITSSTRTDCPAQGCHA